MTDRWLTVLEALRARFAPDADPEEISAFLASQGYDRRQIGEIVARFRSDVVERRIAPAARDGLAAAALPPVRLLGPHEWGRFEPAAWGQLLGCQARGLLTVSELEQVIDRLLSHTEGCIGLPELRAVLEGIGLADLGDDRHPVTIQ